jgi:hypothetical protein
MSTPKRLELTVLIAVAVVTTIGMPMTLARASDTAFDLYQMCSVDGRTAQSMREMEKAWKCISYLSGYIDGIELAEIRTGDNGIACLPKNMQLGQVRLVFNAWASQHTNELQKPAFLALAHALGEAFVCR